MNPLNQQASREVDHAGAPFKAVGRDVTIWPYARIVNRARISIGDRVMIDDFALIIGGSETSIGSFVHIAAFACITGGGRFLMEDFAGLSGGVKVYTGNEQYGGECLTNPTVPSPFRTPIRGMVSIGRHAIVGANSVILPDVTIGEGAVVGACSLVTRNCEPWTVYSGVPARKIALRPNAEIYRLERELRAKYYTESGCYRSESDGT